jgi:hypothetical protein
MHFRLVFDIPFFAATADRDIEFEAKAQFGPVAILLKRKAEGDYAWQCIATCQREPNDKVKSIFQRLHDGTLAPEKEWESYGLRVLELIGPAPYRAFVDETQLQLAAAARHCVSLIQWRFMLRGNHHPLQRGNRLWWSFDGEQWKAAPGIAGLEAEDLFSIIPLDTEYGAEASRLLQLQVGEPLGHELLREAQQLRHRGERAAFVVAVMAAEVGLKECLIDLVPQTEWLLKNIQSPPLPKLLEELLPTVPAKCTFAGKVLAPSATVLKTIKNAVNIRNDIVHKGSHPKTREKLDDVLEAVRDVLYLLDYYRGHKWALNLVSADLRKELEEATK